MNQVLLYVKVLIAIPSIDIKDLASIQKIYYTKNVLYKRSTIQELLCKRSMQDLYKIYTRSTIKEIYNKKDLPYKKTTVKKILLLYNQATKTFV